MFTKSPTWRGQAVEVRWQIEVRWREKFHSYYLIPHDPLGCRYPDNAVRLQAQGSNTSQLRIARDGSVVDAEITESSGIPEIDSATLDCAKTRRYAPWRAESPEVKEIELQSRSIYKLPERTQGFVPEAQEAPTFESLKAEASSDQDCSSTDFSDFTAYVCKRERLLWYFTKADNPANPGVIKEAAQIGSKCMSLWKDRWIFATGNSNALEKSRAALFAWMKSLSDTDLRLAATFTTQPLCTYGL
jgi:TonB family protein